MQIIKQNILAIVLPGDHQLGREELKMTANVAPDECVLLALYPSLLDEKIGNKAVEYFAVVAETFKLPLSFNEQFGLGSSEIDSLLDRVTKQAVDIKYPRLLLAGGYLEDDVTMVCLEALARGFDVFMLADNIVARDDAYQQLHLQRLFQAGAVPTTLKQFLYQWLNHIGDMKLRESAKLKLRIL